MHLCIEQQGRRYQLVATPDDNVHQMMDIHGAVRRLPPTQAAIVALHYGLIGDEACTLRATARELGMRERIVKQMLAQALGRLRSMVRAYAA